MANLPIEFFSSAKASNHVDQIWMVQSGEYETNCAIPPEFGGKGGGFSPEDLFLQSAINCFVGTFKVIAKGSRILFDQVQVEGKLIVDKNETGKTVMKSIHLKINISGADRPERLETIVSKTIKDGFILNSMKTEITSQLNLIESM